MPKLQNNIQAKKIRFPYGAFTLIEILVTIAILATLSVLAYTSYAGYIKHSYDSERMAAIDYLTKSLESSYEIQKVLPEPNSNFIVYDDRGSYLHTTISGSTVVLPSSAYGLSGYASRDFLPAGFLNFSVLDPETKQFYAYGKLANNQWFSLATVVSGTDGEYKTYLRGNYREFKLTSLIRSYASSDFVSDGSTDALPYNPYDRKITAQIVAHSGVVVVNNTPTFPLTGELNSGDSVMVATGSTAHLHISDGSDLFLGTASGQTVLELKNLTYSDDNNLSSKVSLFLSAGEVWVEAPVLRSVTDSPSDFTIQTDSAVAAVRGTVFSLSNNAGKTDIGLVAGKLKVAKIVDGSSIPFSQMNGFTTTQSGWFILSNAWVGGSSMESHMVVRDGESPVSLKNIEAHGYTTSTGTIDPSVIEKKIERPRFSGGYVPRFSKVTFNDKILSIELENPGALSYDLRVFSGALDTNDGNISAPTYVFTGTLDPLNLITTVSWSISEVPNGTQRTFALRLCRNGECSAPLIGSVPNPDSIVENTDRSDIPRMLKCPEKQKPFWKFGCQDENLVAFAPYNHTLSLSGTIGMFTADQKNLLDGQATMNTMMGNEWVPVVDATGSILSAGGWTCSYSLSTASKPSRLLDLKSFWVSLFSDYKVLEYNQSGKNPIQGVYPDNCGNDTFMRYNLSEVDLSNGFSIEIGVRGGALKRIGGWYNLLWLSSSSGGTNNTYTDYWMSINSSSLLGLYTGCTDTGSCSPSAPISSINLLGVPLLPNNFYTVRADFWGNKAHVSIKWDGVNISGNMAIQAITNSPYLFIWSRPDKYNQWNDIIDFVKIYKN